MKKLLLVLAQLLLCATAVAQPATSCGVPCLSKSDQLTLSHTRETLDLFVKEGERYLPGLRNVSSSDGDVVYKNTSRYFLRHAEDLTELRRKAENVHLRRVIGRHATALTEFSELLDAGAVLIAAKRENNYQMLAGAAKLVNSEDAKALLAPVGSLVELQMRADRFIRLVRNKVQFLQSEVELARKEFWEKTGIDLFAN